MRGDIFVRYVNSFNISVYNPATLSLSVGCTRGWLLCGVTLACLLLGAAPAHAIVPRPVKAKGAHASTATVSSPAQAPRRERREQVRRGFETPLFF